MQQNFLNNLPPEIKDTGTQLYDTILERSLMQAYEDLDDEKKAMMTKIFDSGNEKEKNDFLHNHLKNLENIMMEETKKIMVEIKKNKDTTGIQ